MLYITFKQPRWRASEAARLAPGPGQNPRPEARAAVHAPKSFGYRQSTQRHQRRDAAYAVILDDKQRVACVVDKRRLFLPGGGLEAEEDALQAVHREVAEECAMALEIISPLDSAVQFFRAARGQAYELRASFFLARFGSALDRPAQHELRWLSVAPAPPLFYHECHRWAVEQAVSRRTA